MTSEQSIPILIDFLEDDERKEERARVAALQAFLDDGGAIAESELEKIENDAVINEEIAHLDEECSHINQTVLVSGDVRIGYFDDFREEDAEETRRLSDMLLISRGFTVQPVRGDNDDRLLVGHLFEVLGSERTSGAHGLAQQSTTYFAFAPYDTVAIEMARTDKQRRTYLESMIPEIVSEIDELLYDAPSPLAAMLRLRKLSINRADIPADIIRELITYVSEFIAVKQIPLSVFELAGTRSIDINDDFSITAPYDIDDYTGGSVAVAGKIDYIYLSPYVAYVDGEMYQTSDCRWAVGISAEAASHSHPHLAGQTLDVMIADIRDGAPVVPVPPRAGH